MDTELLYCSAAIRTFSVQPVTCSPARRVLKLNTKVFCFSNRNIFALSELSTMKATSSEHVIPVGEETQQKPEIHNTAEDENLSRKAILLLELQEGS